MDSSEPLTVDLLPPVGGRTVVSAPSSNCRAAICSVATGADRELMARSAPSMAAYARRHGWSLVLSSEPLNGERSPSWGKIELVRKLLETYDYVFCVDADVSINDLDRNLLDEVGPATSDIWFARRAPQGDTANPEFDPGVFLVRSTPSARRLLTEVWNAERFVDHRWREKAALLNVLGYSLEPPFSRVNSSEREYRVGVLDLAWLGVPRRGERSSPVVNHHSLDAPDVERCSIDMVADPSATASHLPTSVLAADVRPGTEPAVNTSTVARLAARGFRFLFLLDFLTLFGAIVFIGMVRFGEPWPDRSAPTITFRFATATLLQIAICYFVGLYDREPRLGSRSWFPKAVVSMVIGVGVQAALIALGVYLMPRGNLLPWAVLGSVVLVVDRAMSRWLASRRLGPARVALVGTESEIDLAYTQFAAAHATVVVVCTLPSTASLPAEVERHQVTDVLLLDVGAFNEVFPHPLTELEAQGVSFLQRVGAQATLLGLSDVREVAGLPCVRLRSHSLPSHQHRLKRILDLLFLLLVAPLVLVISALLACWVRLRAGSPVIYRQTRTGRDGVPFQLIKFRTMRHDAELAGAELATADDPRVVPGLGWMRSTRLDELPQLWNVLRGEMSVVGPRPERPEFSAEFERRIPGYVRRQELPPGITGLAQVQGRYDTDAAYKLGYDLQYVSDWSPALDLQILLRTIWVVVMRRV